MKFCSLAVLSLGLAAPLLVADDSSQGNDRSQEEDFEYSICHNDMLDLQDALANAMADLQQAWRFNYWCYSNSGGCPWMWMCCLGGDLDLASLPEEASWQVACMAAGGVLYEIIPHQQLCCNKAGSDGVFAWDLVGYLECVPPNRYAP